MEEKNILIIDNNKWLVHYLAIDSIKESQNHGTVWVGKDL